MRFMCGFCTTLLPYIGWHQANGLNAFCQLWVRYNIPFLKSGGAISWWYHNGRQGCRTLVIIGAIVNYLIFLG